MFRELKSADSSSTLASRYLGRGPVPGTWAGIDPPGSRSLLGKNQTLFSPSKRLLPKSAPWNPPDAAQTQLRIQVKNFGQIRKSERAKCFSLLLDVVTMATVFFQGRHRRVGKSCQERALGYPRVR